MFSREKRDLLNPKILCAILALIPAPFASAGLILDFTPVTRNNPASGLIGAAQFHLTIEDDAGLINFTFANQGPDNCTISEIYFDDDNLLQPGTIFNPAGIQFQAGANPPNLPGGNNITPGFSATPALSIQAHAPAQKNGINPGASLTLRCALQEGRTVADFYQALNDGALRIGLHANGFPTLNSEAFVNAPEPATLALILAGLLCRRRKRKM